MTKSNNTQGNQYHDEEGKFTSKDDVGSKKDSFEKVFNPQLNDLEIDNLISTYFNDFFTKKEMPKEEKEINIENNGKKRIVEMSDDELRVEIAEHNQYFRENKIGLGRPKDFNGDLKLRCANYRKFVELHKKYPVNFSETTFTFSARFKRTYAYVSSQCNEGFGIFLPNVDIKFNTNTYYTSFENVLMKCNKHIKSNWQQKGNDDELLSYTLTHEYGHALQNEIAKNEVFNKNKFTENKLSEFENNIKFAVKKIYDAKYNDGGFYSEVSRYGKTNSAEWFAETFASLNCGQPTKAALCLGEYLKNNGYGG